MPARVRLGLFAVLLLISLPTIAQTGKSPSSSGSTPGAKEAADKTDPQKEALVFEKIQDDLSFEADGTGTQETTVTVRIQSQAGLKEFSILTVPYSSYNQSVDVDYVRVRKPDGTVVVTPDYNVQDMPGEVTRTAPMYSDFHQ